MLKDACMYMSARLPFLHNEMIPSSSRMPNCSTAERVKHQVYAGILFKRNEQKKKIMSSDTRQRCISWPVYPKQCCVQELIL